MIPITAPGRAWLEGTLVPLGHRVLRIPTHPPFKAFAYRLRTLEQHALPSEYSLTVASRRSDIMLPPYAARVSSMLGACSNRARRVGRTRSSSHSRR